MDRSQPLQNQTEHPEQPVLRQAGPSDAPLLAQMELLCFPEAPWSLESMKSELSGLNETLYLIAELPESKQIVAYGGIWLVAGEGQITNLAVHPAFRRRGYGRMVLTHLIAEAEARGARCETLEVRRSNYAAQALYQSMGFCEMGCRRGYYSDNHEDALVYWKGEPL